MTAQEFRMDLHKIPEEGYKEFKTKQYILSHLGTYDCKIFEIEETGLVAFFDFGKQSATAIRTDIDALPIKEQTGLPFASVHEGYMHACGHDGHMAMALATAQYVTDLKKSGKELCSNVAFVFQPAEELDGGARHIIASGVLQKLNVTKMYGMHLWPDLEKGKIFSKSGAMLARSSETNVTILGRSCHIADSSKGIDSLHAAADLLMRLYALEEECNKEERCVLKFGKITSGTLRNIISDKTVMNGSTRVLSDAMFDKIRRGIEENIAAVEKIHGVTAELSMSTGYPPVINDKALFEEAYANCGIQKLTDAFMQAEDFSFYASICPTLFFFLGVGGGTKLHNDKFDFDMSVLDRGVELYKKLLSL